MNKINKTGASVWLGPYILPVDDKYYDLSMTDKFFMDLTGLFVQFTLVFEEKNNYCGKYEHFDIKEITLKIPKTMYNALMKYIRKRKGYGKNIVSKGFLSYVTDTLDVCYIPQKLKYNKGITIIIIDDTFEIDDTVKSADIKLSGLIELKCDL